MAEMKDHLTKVSRLMSGDMSALMPLSLQIPLYGCQCFTGNNGVFVCPVNQPEYLAHLRDFAFAGYESYDVDAAVQYRNAETSRWMRGPVP